jgi:uncharacterized protein (TIGR00369 family)
MAWKRQLTLDALNATSANTMVAHLGIVYTRLEEGVLEAEMPVDARTHQPFGLLHGGASAALAETLGSMAGWLMTEEGSAWWGPSSTPPITGRSPAAKSAANAAAAPGASGQSWEIVVFDERGRRCCTCRPVPPQPCLARQTP